jgi:hypothetical protein
MAHALFSTFGEKRDTRWIRMIVIRWKTLEFDLIENLSVSQFHLPLLEHGAQVEGRKFRCSQLPSPPFGLEPCLDG